MQKLLLLFAFCLIGFCTFGQKKKKPALPEQAYVQQLAGALQSENLIVYQALMPAPEVLAPLTPVLPKLLRHSGLDSAELQSDGYRMALERSAARNFQRILEQGRAMGIRWQTVQLSRYELVKSLKTRDSVLERLVPERYRGYVFITDLYLRKTFCIGIADLFFQDGKGQGGMMTRIFPAATVGEYETHLEKALAAEAKGLLYDLGNLAEDEETDEIADSAALEDAPVLPKGIVSERRYYRGYFDDDTRIELYLRGYAGDCGQSTCRWVAVMHIGDEDEWLPMQVVQKDSVWTFTEMPDKAVMELTLSEEWFTGSWQNSNDNTGYEVEMSSRVPSKNKYREADEALNEHGL